MNQVIEASSLQKKVHFCKVSTSSKYNIKHLFIIADILVKPQTQKFSMFVERLACVVCKLMLQVERLLMPCLMMEELPSSNQIKNKNLAPSIFFEDYDYVVDDGSLVILHFFRCIFFTLFIACVFFKNTATTRAGSK